MNCIEREMIGECVLIRADCREVLDDLYADALITDPPYGVGLTGKTTKNNHITASSVYCDTPAYVQDLITFLAAWWPQHTKRTAIFTGIRLLWQYPPAKDIGGIYCPNGAGRGPWGFVCFNPILFYGSNPHHATGQAPTVLYSTHPGGHVTGEATIDHPCPKPLAWMRWLVNRASLPGETVLDAFAGSFTTGVACVQLGRRFIGIELDEYYFQIGCQRIYEAYRQPDLFLPRSPQPTQEALL